MAERMATMALADMKLKVAEHIWVQNYQRKTSVPEILAENKVGIQQRSDLVKVLKGIFSVTK